MNAKHIFFMILILLGIFSSSCTKDFNKINKNPNVPQEVAPEFLLTNAIVEGALYNGYYQSFRLANYLAQYAASVEFERIDRYEMGPNSSYWNLLYKLQLDIETMKQLPSSNEAYWAIGEVLSCYYSSQLTDMWGDVPYTEAVDALSEEFTPTYDLQENIYLHPETGIIARLDAAANVLKNTQDRVAGDVMFQGNVDKWVRFSRALKLRYLLRISKRLNDFSALQALVDSGELMRGNEDNAVLPYTSMPPNQFPLYAAAEGLYQEHTMTKTIDSIMTELNDSRMMVYYKPSKNSSPVNPEYNGLLNGQSRETISEKGINLNDISLFGSIFRDVPDGVDAQFMQYSEQEFAIAEAIERNYIVGDVNTHYENAIMASYDYYDVEPMDRYFDQENVELNNSDNLNKILTQKWISLINNGHEAWFNVRRTGIPALKAGPDNLNNGRLPSRYLYPQSEQATNAENYMKVIERIGGDNINIKCWWQKD